MKEFTATQYFDYPWDYVTAANWRKYPNEISTHVVAVDVLRREFDPTNQILKSERLITCKQPIPKWLKYFVGPADTSYVREISIVDRLGKTLTLRSVNLTMAKLLKVYETVVYSPDLKDPHNRTTFLQSAKFKSSAGWSKIENQIETWAVDRFRQNASKGKLGFDSILKLGVLDNKLTELSQSASNLLDEINQKTSNLLNDINNTSDEILNEIDLNTIKLLNEIKNCNVFKDINNISLDILKEMSIKTGNAIDDLNKTSSKVLEEVNQMSENLNLAESKREILDKTSHILNEIDSTQKKISDHIGNETKIIIEALNNKTLELINNLNNSTTTENINNNDIKNNNQLLLSSDANSTFKSYISTALFKIIHPFSKT